MYTFGAKIRRRRSRHNSREEEAETHSVNRRRSFRFHALGGIRKLVVQVRTCGTCDSEADLAVVLRELNTCKVEIQNLVAEINRLELALLRAKCSASTRIHAPTSGALANTQ